MAQTQLNICDFTLSYFICLTGFTKVPLSIMLLTMSIPAYFIELNLKSRTFSALSWDDLSI